MFNSNRPSDWALYLFENFGFRVFPLSPNSKVPPKCLKWQEWAKECSSEKISKYATANPTANWAIDCEGSNITVIDVDNKGAKKGSEELKKLEQLPVTLTIETPSGGFHYFFTGLYKSSTSKLADGIDTKSKGGYVVAAGSKIDGKRYEVFKHHNNIPQLPQFYANKLTVYDAPVVLKDDTLIEEGNRTNTLLSLAGAMRRRGFSRDAIFAAINVENERLSPPLSDREVENIANSVAKYSPETASAGVEFEKLENNTRPPKKLTDFVGEPPRRQWLINDWIPANEISSLYGSGGTGKSLLSLQLAFSVATGMPFLDQEVKTKMPVLAVFCEDNDEELHRRIHDIRKAPEMEFLDDIDQTDVRLWARVGLNNDIARQSKDGNDIVEGTFRPELEEQLASMPKGQKLLILDTLSDVYLGDENVREKVNKFVKTHLSSLAIKYNLTILILAHPSRSGQKGDMLSGSTAWENAVRNRLAFVPHETVADIMVLKRMKSNYAKRGEEIYLNWDAGRFKTVATEQHKTAGFVSDIMMIYTNIKVNDMPLAEFTELVLEDSELAFLFKGVPKNVFGAKLKREFRVPRNNEFFEFMVKGTRFLKRPLSTALDSMLS